MSRYRVRRRNIRKLKHKRKTHIILSVTALFVLTTLMISFGGIMAVGAVLSNLPKLDEKALNQSWQTTKIFASDGTLLTNLYYEQDRIVVPLSEISPDLQHAVIAIEDERFYKHKGYDPEAILRALFTNLASGEVVEGASTISQQYIKNTVVSREKTFERKLKEAALAYELEKKYSKDEILERYLNTIYFGHSWYGVETASINYFGKRAKDLNLQEAALLAAIIQSPNNYSPYTRPDRAKERRDRVLKNMLKQKYITAAQEASATATPIQIKPIQKPVSIAPYFVEYVKQELLKKYDENVVFKGGLRVYTTIDLKMQKHAEAAAWNILNRPGDPAVALTAIEPKTGYIRAMVGGRDFEKSKYNLALSHNRQPGSSFKTFVLAAAIEDGKSIYETYESSPVTIPIPGSKPWKVDNYIEGSGGPPMPLHQALVRSVNTVFARLIMDVGAQKVAELAQKMGISVKINPNPAIALGGFSHGPSTLDMASAYGTIANGGRYNPPTAITKIGDSRGKVIEEHKLKPTQAISEATAYILTGVLEDVINHGTGTRARIGRPAAGKTGTAQAYRDAWFCGFTPDLSTAVWVGHPETTKKSMYNVHGVRVAGGTFPAQIWGSFMSNSLRGTPRSAFVRPKGGYKEVSICAETELLANFYCPKVERRVFLKGKGPKERCNIHTSASVVEIPSFIGMRRTDAIKTIREMRFGYRSRYQPDPAATYGTVIGQVPPAGSKIRQGATIELIVSAGQGRR